MAELVAGDSRIHIVPIDAVFSSYNYKTNAAANKVNEPGKIISNIMLEGPDLFFSTNWQGGLMGLDGMHPTIVGYAIMAQEIVKSIVQHEPDIVVHAMPDVNLAYQADTLLQKVPLSWDAVLDLSLDIRRALANLPATQTPSGIKYDAVNGLLNALQFKYD
jgi:hypothetical protein